MAIICEIKWKSPKRWKEWIHSIEYESRLALNEGPIRRFTFYLNFRIFRESFQKEQPADSIEWNWVAAKRFNYVCCFYLRLLLWNRFQEWWHSATKNRQWTFVWDDQMATSAMVSPGIEKLKTLTAFYDCLLIKFPILILSLLFLN